MKSICLQSWASGIPHFGGNNDETNLSRIVHASLSQENRYLLTELKGKITRYFSINPENLERLEKVAIGLIGMKVQFQDGFEYISLKQLQIFVNISSRFGTQYRSGKIQFHHLKKSTFVILETYLTTFKFGYKFPKEELIEVYLTFGKDLLPFFIMIDDDLKRIKGEYDNEKFVFYYRQLKNDRFFQKRINTIINMLSANQYAQFIKSIANHELREVKYSSHSSFKEVLDLTHSAPSVVLSSITIIQLLQVKNRTKIELRCDIPVTFADVELLKLKNPDLKEAVVVHGTAFNGGYALCTPSLKSLTLERCRFSSLEWKYIGENLNGAELILRNMLVHKDDISPILSKLSSLTLDSIDENSRILFGRELPFNTLSLQGVELPLQIFNTQPKITVLALDPHFYEKKLKYYLNFFPNLECLDLSTNFEVTFCVSQELFLVLYEKAPNIRRLILSGLEWKKIPALKIKFPLLEEIEISFTNFYDMKLEILLNNLNFMCQNLKTITYGAHEAIHYRDLIEKLKTQFRNINFVQKA